jgi:hypothetical protein
VVVLFQSGATVDQLKGAGFALRELQGACFSATRPWDAGASGQVFKVWGWSAAVLKDACWSAQSLRATEAMHKILSHLIRFDCVVCKERFAAFHPAYEPPNEVASKMEVLRPGWSGLAPCSVQVSTWHSMPEFEITDDLAPFHEGVCKRCQNDMDAQALQQEGVEGDACIVAKRSEDNHMDPCFRFPSDDLQELFDGATMIEGMLVALEHMHFFLFLVLLVV